MKAVKRLFALILTVFVCVFAPFTANSAEKDTLNGIKSAVEGIISYKCSTYNVNSTADLFDSLSDKAGTYSSDWYYIALSQYGEECVGSRSISALKNTVEGFYDKGPENVKATDMQRVALALLSLGESITDVNGHNLLADCTYNRKNYKSLEEQGVNALAFALILLDSKDFSIPSASAESREDIIDKILGLELSGGGFAITGTYADPDITAIVLQALSPYKSKGQVSSVIERGVQLLSQCQAESGAFKSFGKENAESTAQVIIALTSLGINPYTDSRFLKNGNNIVDGLMNFRLENGAFCHITGYSADNMATYQSLMALVSVYRFLNNQGRFYDFTVKNTADNSENPNKSTTFQSSTVSKKNSHVKNSSQITETSKSSNSSSSDNPVSNQNSSEIPADNQSKKQKKSSESTSQAVSDTENQPTSKELVLNKSDGKAINNTNADYNSSENSFIYFIPDFLLLTGAYAVLYIVRVRRKKK